VSKAFRHPFTIVALALALGAFCASAQAAPAPPVAPHCTVPKLKGKKLKATKKTLAKADCKLGKVKKLKGATSKTGKVKSQNPKPGKILPPGAKVNVKLDV
jgi:beta-lactam-binding protein with PASTA domain